MESDFANLKALARKEERARRKVDPYREKETLLHEMADSKFR